MSVLTLTATAQPDNVPPRVRIDVTDTGSSPALTAATVTRTDGTTGLVSTVRTSTGGPLQLTTSGSVRVGTVYDVEMPHGTPVTYSTVEQPANTAGPVTVSSADVWLIHPGVPGRSLPIVLRIGSHQEELLPVKQGVFEPVARRNALVITDGQRKSGRSTLTVATETPDELAALLDLLDDASTVLLNPPASNDLGLSWSYLAVGDVTVRRRTDIGTDPKRDVVLPYTVTDPPWGGSQSQWTWTNVEATYATWADLKAANATWAAVQDPTS